MEELRARAAAKGFPRVLLVHLGTPEEGERFFSSRWPEARAVSDPDQSLYRAFGLQRASWSQLFGPRVFAAGLRAVRHGVGRPVGNPLRMSGWFFLADGIVRWAHAHENAGCARRYDSLLEAVRGLDETAA